MPLAPGERLGPYEILGPLGAGGMGEVYKARDTRLDRTVAIKVAKEAFGERFRNEALAVAALNHRHIAALYDIGPDYLVMEFVDGKPLRGPLPVPEALRLAGQVADALEHAHRNRIVHRDLKPSNLLVAKGNVKVLDFGLAKRVAAASPSDQSETTLSEDRALMGTPTYMAPEQIDGRKVDERTDVFAFGLVLYELLAGRRAFEGTSAPSVMAAILEKEPPALAAVKPDTPPALADVVATCLAKDPADRWQSVRELKHALAWAARTPVTARTAARSKWSLLAAAAAVGLLGLAVGLALANRKTPPRPLPVRFEVPLPGAARLPWGETLALSPDGRRLALAPRFPDGKRLCVRSLDSVDFVPVPGAEGAMKPFWSADGKQIAFGAGYDALRRMDLAGGPSQTICKLPGFLDQGTWSADNVILFSARGRIFRVPARGGEPEPVGSLASGETGRAMPFFLPDGRHYLYLSLTARPEERAIYVGALDSDLRKRLVASSAAAAYSASGHLLFVKGDTLMAQRFDASRQELSGDAFVAVEQIGVASGPQYAGSAFFSVAGDGVLAWRPGPAWDVLQLTWFDRTGKTLGTLGDPATYFRPTLSPDERSVAVCRTEPNGRNLWIFDVVSGGSRRLTFDAADNCGPAWSPDGSRLAFFSNRRGLREIYEKRVDGSGDDELALASTGEPLHAEDWRPDGRFLAYNSSGPKNPSDIFLLPMSGAAREGVAFLAGESVEQGAAFSPDSRYVAYWSDETGRTEVYVKGISLQGVAGQGKWQISKDGGTMPRWRRDGKELFFVKGASIMAVEVKTEGPSFEAGVPRLVLEVPLAESPPDRPFDVTRDGQRFLVNTPVKPPPNIRVMANWWPEGYTDHSRSR